MTLSERIKTIFWSVGATLGVIYVVPFLLSHWLISIWLMIGIHLTRKVVKAESITCPHRVVGWAGRIFLTIMWPAIFIFLSTKSWHDTQADIDERKLIKDSIDSDFSSIVSFFKQYRLQSPIKKNI